jgi:saccharopine dehydrogenase-like NADP-dependent oxidoreductase
LLALLNDAKYISDGKVKVIPANQLLQEVSHLALPGGLNLEGYANRDSTSYVSAYHIPEARRVLRGTLRYPGFIDVMQSCKQLGLFNQDPAIAELWQAKPWYDYLEANLDKTLTDYLATNKAVLTEAFEFLGFLDKENLISQSATMLDAFCALLTVKLAYEENEADMVVMQHQFTSHCAEKGEMYRTSTLILEGDPMGYSAMAKTVGTPAAITVEMILRGEINRTGVVLPLFDDFYLPILSNLAKEGISLQESVYTNSTI